ncbi:unnamed protein product [Amoebophrya sp. A25]|nr:unnamed protein product [Amoebophrya sp. A25]|eukprot:GSA25T00021546001.1
MNEVAWQCGCYYCFATSSIEKMTRAPGGSIISLLLTTSRGGMVMTGEGSKYLDLDLVSGHIDALRHRIGLISDIVTYDVGSILVVPNYSSSTNAERVFLSS